MSQSDNQKILFEKIHDRYYESTTDIFSESYKIEFIYPWILRQLGDATSLIEMASGVGTGAGWLRTQRPDLYVEGCDISESAAKGFTEAHGQPCHVWDLTRPIDPARTYDVALVMGGIHHLVANLPVAFANIRKLLNPGGRLIMTEPNADFILEPARKLWYKLDKSNFDVANEHALSHAHLLKTHGLGFRRIDVRYMGGPAYFLLLQSWVLRMPAPAKRWIAPSLTALERLYHHLPPPFPYATFMASWQKI
jgi:SAM-dependent methyltransferase